MSGRLLSSFAVLGAVLLGATGARAGDPVTAEALFRAGREASQRGDHATACAKLAESQKLDPAGGTALNLGDCSEHLDRLASAWQYYQEAADRFGADERGDLARQKVAELLPRLPRLTLRLAAGAPPGAVVARDGVELGAASLDTALPVDAGDHRITVRAPGHAPREVTVHIEDGQSRTVECEAGPAAAADGTGAPASVAQPVGIALGAVGIAGIAAGAVTGFLTIERKNTVAASCDASKACTPAGVAAASEGKTFSAVSTATFIGGAAALAAGVVLVIAGRSSGAPAKAGSARPSATAFVALAPAGAGLSLQGRF